ncbi:hypothetical protein EVAR_60221_1 [Eumeta japonica]|uniref:Uncharacterized protein n=1 Tax=Eumeta variegata TaxID=151549 RepID=A0A4C1ZCC8_EUMVA|nr:hypothetical protein EVAR_60221_1 [Eumeta japonica]
MRRRLLRPKKKGQHMRRCRQRHSDLPPTPSSDVAAASAEGARRQRLPPRRGFDVVPISTGHFKFTGSVCYKIKLSFPSRPAPARSASQRSAGAAAATPIAFGFNMAANMADKIAGKWPTLII